MALIPVLSDEERFPAIGDLTYLKTLRQHDVAPVFNFKSGDRLTEADVNAVKRYHDAIRNSSKYWKPGETPGWLNDYISGCSQMVPAYRHCPCKIEDNRSVRREDLRKAPWAFVSDRCLTDDLLVYSTSGTTGAPLDVLFDRITQATYLPQLQAVLGHHGVTIEGGPGRTSIALICAQQKTLTYASLSTYLDGAGVLKLNLNPDDWRDPDHRNQFLESVNPEILTGDPFAFKELMKLTPEISPKALVSSAMTMLPGLKTALEACFRCPVIDLYSLTECRMIAFKTNSGHQLIRHDLYVETLEPDRDIPVAPGERGELTITGGNNPFLNLIRYRTGDYCSLHHESGRIFLKDLDGRAPVVFLDENGNIVNTIDISRALSGFHLAGFHLHQDRDRSLALRLFKYGDATAPVKSEMYHLFGNSVALQVTCESKLPEGTEKIIPYTSDVAV